MTDRRHAHKAHVGLRRLGWLMLATVASFAIWGVAVWALVQL